MREWGRKAKAEEKAEEKASPRTILPNQSFPEKNAKRRKKNPKKEKIPKKKKRVQDAAE